MVREIGPWLPGEGVTGFVPASGPGVRDDLDLLPAEVATPPVIQEREATRVHELLEALSGHSEYLGGLTVGGEPRMTGGVPLQGKDLHVHLVKAVSLPLHRLGQPTLGDPLVDRAGPQAQYAGGLAGAELLVGPGSVLTLTGSVGPQRSRAITNALGCGEGLLGSLGLADGPTEPGASEGRSPAPPADGCLIRMAVWPVGRPSMKTICSGGRVRVRVCPRRMIRLSAAPRTAHALLVVWAWPGSASPNLAQSLKGLRRGAYGTTAQGEKSHAPRMGRSSDGRCAAQADPWIPVGRRNRPPKRLGRAHVCQTSITAGNHSLGDTRPR